MAAGFFLFSSVSAFADGFVCLVPNRDLKIKIYNYTDPDEGTRNAAVMVLSDPTVSDGRKTIARFSDIDSTLDNYGAAYEAEVDLSNPDTGRAGERILGTRLGSIDRFKVELAFNYNSPVADGEEVFGSLHVLKKNGEEIPAVLECVRYLKN